MEGLGGKSERVFIFPGIFFFFFLKQEATSSDASTAQYS